MQLHLIVDMLWYDERLRYRPSSPAHYPTDWDAPLSFLDLHGDEIWSPKLLFPQRTHRILVSSERSALNGIVSYVVENGIVVKRIHVTDWFACEFHNQVCQEFVSYGI